MKILQRLSLIYLASMLVGCWGHVFPLTNTFVHPVPTRINMFVDANGTFYPAGWRGNICHLERSLSWPADSLLVQARACPGLVQLIAGEEGRQLDALEDFAKDKNRIFILIHGYNNTPTEANQAYDAIEERLPTQPGDMVVHFYWDGLTGTGIGGGKIWFNATAYSKLAGSRGLRRVLDRLHGKDVFLIAHSRGASVVLSALRDPLYTSSFHDKTKKLGLGLFNTLPPRPNGNRLYILWLAPAIDVIDFCTADDRQAVADADKSQLRSGIPRCAFPSFDDQVASIRYTVNRRDPVLNKFIGLSHWFNPSSLGLKVETGKWLERFYPKLLLPAYVLNPSQKFHHFTNYVGTENFTSMLSAAILECQQRRLQIGQSGLSCSPEAPPS